MVGVVAAVVEADPWVLKYHEVPPLVAQDGRLFREISVLHCGSFGNKPSRSSALTKTKMVHSHFRHPLQIHWPKP